MPSGMTGFEIGRAMTPLSKDAAGGFGTPARGHVFAASAGIRDWHDPCFAMLAGGLAMIAGVVTTKDVLLNWPAIVHGFGLRTWLSCCKAVLTGRRTTFLELVWFA
jgi:hypothetical protein